MKTVELGTTGILVSQLSFGTGTNGWGGRSNQTDLTMRGRIWMAHPNASFPFYKKWTPTISAFTG